MFGLFGYPDTEHPNTDYKLLFMKIESLEIRQLNQFSRLLLDFTYPKGHLKAGQPLEKICIIGQSGTGKTTILKILESLFTEHHNSSYPLTKWHIRDNGATYRVRVLASGTKSYRRLEGQGVINVPFEDISTNKKNALMFMPADFLSVNSMDTDEEAYVGKSTYNFGEISVNAIWNRLLDDVREHKRKMKEIMDLINSINSSNRPASQKREEAIPLYNQLEELEQINNNPLKSLAAECLDIALEQFNLKVVTDYKDDDTSDKIEFIKLADKNGKVIPNGLLSSGTKQFILSAIPFYLLKPDDTVILFDEPERSLYPNIQKLLVDHYSKLAKDSQFFYATHSPIVASCFDPWEVIELKFDVNGYIYQEQYYEGERHVNNYIVHPKYLTYELILKQVFDVQDTEGDDRAKKMTEFFMLEDRLKAFKKRGDNQSDEFNNTMQKYLNIGNLISWPTELES